MKRIHALLTFLLVALVSGAWVIKDTANPVDIYTGSNTTPSISAATNGSVTLGPTGGAAVHQANLSDGGSLILDGQFTGSSTSNHFLKVGRAGQAVQAAIGYNDSATAMYLGTTTNHPLHFRTNNALRGSISAAGAWTISNLGKGVLESSSAGVVSSTNLWTTSAGIYGTTCTTNIACVGFLGLGGGITDITRTSTGTYTANFTASFWNGQPNCTISQAALNSVYCITGNITTSAAPINCYSDAGALTDSRPILMCQGVRN